MDERATREFMCEIGRRMYAREMVSSNDGNISVRLPDNTVLCTPTGVSKGFMSPECICKVDINGNVLDAKEGYAPSTETKMHLRIYNSRPDINAAVHAHPPYATTFAVAGEPITTPIMPEVIVNFGCIPMAPYGTPSTNEVPDSIDRYLPYFDAVLLEYHGALTYASTLEKAYMKMESVEYFARLLIQTRNAGCVRTLTKEQLDKIYDLRVKSGLPEWRPEIMCAKGKGPDCYNCTGPKSE